MGKKIPLGAPSELMAILHIGRMVIYMTVFGLLSGECEGHKSLYSASVYGGQNKIEAA